MKPICLIGLWVMLCLAPPVISGTIYTWIDSEGKQHFSEEPPPDTVTEYKKTQTEPPFPGQTQLSPERRVSYDQMVEKAKKEALQSEQQRRKEAEARAIQEKREAEKRRKARIEPERRRLEQAIKDLENRALSPTFSMGMKKAQIEKLRKELEKLMASP
jgi:type IV secretory pathway VirB10-like protein